MARRLTMKQKNAIVRIMMNGALDELASLEELSEDEPDGQVFMGGGLTADEIVQIMAEWFYNGRIPKATVWNNGLPKVWE